MNKQEERRKQYKATAIGYCSSLRKRLCESHRKAKRLKLHDTARSFGESIANHDTGAIYVLESARRYLESNCISSTVSTLKLLLHLLQTNDASQGLQHEHIDILLTCLQIENIEARLLALDCLLEIFDSNIDVASNPEYVKQICQFFNLATESIDNDIFSNGFRCRAVDTTLLVIKVLLERAPELMEPQIEVLLKQGINYINKWKSDGFLKVFASFLCTTLELNFGYDSLIAELGCFQLMLDILKTNVNNAVCTYRDPARSKLGDVFYVILYFTKSSKFSIHNGISDICSLYIDRLLAYHSVCDIATADDGSCEDSYVQKMDVSHADVIVPILEILTFFVANGFHSCVVKICSLPKFIVDCFGSCHRSVKLASLNLCIEMASLIEECSSVILAITRDTVGVFRSNDNYDILLRTAIFFLEIYRNPLYSDMLRQQMPEILGGFLKLIRLCKHHYMSVQVSLDFFEEFIKEPNAIETLLNSNAIEIFEGAQYLHDKNVRDRIDLLIQAFDVVDILHHRICLKDVKPCKMIIINLICDWYEQIVSLITRTSYSQRVLCGHNTLQCILAIINGLPPVGCKVHNIKALVVFESICRQKLEPLDFQRLQESDDTKQIVDLLIKTLEVDPHYRHLVEDAVEQIQTLHAALTQFENLALVPVSKESAEHVRLLHECWKLLDDRPLPESFDISQSVNKPYEKMSSWGDLGFQSPFSDFRRTGLLGLKCMHYMAKNYTPQTKLALEQSRIPQVWFPFALASIHTTDWVLQFWREFKLCGLSFYTTISCMEVFCLVHSFVFFKLVRFWSNSNPKSIMEFNAISLRFRGEIIANLDEMIDMTYMLAPNEPFGDVVVQKLAKLTSSM